MTDGIEYHKWKDRDIQEVVDGVSDTFGKLQTVELHIANGTDAIILGRSDVIVLAKHFNIV